MSKGKYLLQIANFDNVIKNVSDKIIIYRPGEIFCRNPDCEFMTFDRRPFYFDDDHLTLTGAHQLTPFFFDFLRKLKNK